MTEKEKMLSQLLYDADHDDELVADRRRARDLCHEFNSLKPSDTQARRALMEELLGRTSGPFAIMSPFFCDYGFNIEIGENFFANYNTVILDCAKVTLVN